MERFSNCEVNEKWEKVKEKAAYAWDKTVTVGKTVMDYASKNPLVSSVIVGAASSIVRQAMLTGRQKREMDHESRTVYDRRTGMRYTMSRTPSPNQQKIIASRLQNGESLVKILEDLKLF